MAGSFELCSVHMESLWCYVTSIASARPLVGLGFAPQRPATSVMPVWCGTPMTFKMTSKCACTVCTGANYTHWKVHICDQRTTYVCLCANTINKRPGKRTFDIYFVISHNSLYPKRDVNELGLGHCYGGSFTACASVSVVIQCHSVHTPQCLCCKDKFWGCMCQNHDLIMTYAVVGYSGIVLTSLDSLTCT